MPKIIRGKNRESRVKRLEDSIEVERKGRKEKLGPPDWAKDKGKGKKKGKGKGNK